MKVRKSPVQKFYLFFLNTTDRFFGNFLRKALVFLSIKKFFHHQLCYGNEQVRKDAKISVRRMIRMQKFFLNLVAVLMLHFDEKLFFDSINAD